MPGWDSYRTVHRAELRAAARELHDHGWTVVEESAGALDPGVLRLVTGTVLDVLEVPSVIGGGICAALRTAGEVVPVAGTPTGSWWYPITVGHVLPAPLADVPGVTLHTAGATVLAPPSAVPDGWVHWRVAPALVGHRVPAADLVLSAAVASLRRRADHDRRPGAQRPAAAVVAGPRF